MRQQQRQNAPRQARQPTREQQAADRDTMIENRIVRRLAERAYMGKDFQVKVGDGVVTLSGTVPSDRDRDRIVRVVRQMPGVENVNANFRIAPATRATEPAIADAALARQTAQRVAAALQGAKAGEDWWLEGWRVEGPDTRGATTGVTATRHPTSRTTATRDLRARRCPESRGAP